MMSLRGFLMNLVSDWPGYILAFLIYLVGKRLLDGLRR